MVKDCGKHSTRNPETNRCRKDCKDNQRRNSKGKCVKDRNKKLNQIPDSIPPQFDQSVSTDFIPKKDTKDKKVKRKKLKKGISIDFLPRGHTVFKDPKGEEDNCGLSEKNIKKIGKKTKIESHIRRSIKKIGKNGDPCIAFEKLFDKRIIPSGWRITKLLGAGSFGVVLGTRGPKNEKGALKIINERNSKIVDSEIKLANEFYKLGISPSSKRMAHVKIGGQHLYAIHMDRIDGVIAEYLKKTDPSIQRMDMIVEKIFRLVDIMDKKKLIHGDLHWENIGFTHARDDSVGKLQVIDLGYAYSGKSLPALEFVQLLRGLHFEKMDGNVSSLTFKYLDGQIREKALVKYGFRFPTNFMKINDKFSSLRNELRSIRKL